MKKITILPLLLLCLISWGQSQFVVQNGSKTEVYNNINTAITNAVAGDTLYIPGGGFTITNTTIDKTLHWVGHGHYPDSTQATMQSRINTPLTFSGNCDGSSFEGIFFTNDVKFGSTSDEAINVKLKRCRILGTVFLRIATTGNPALNFQISECTLQNLNANNGSNCLVKNSLIFGSTQYFYQSNFIHNNFNANSSTLIYYCQSCLYEDNVFSNTYGLYYSYSNNLINNIFSGAIPYSPPGDSNIGSNNIYNVGTANIFIDVSHSTNINTFSYDNDYHLNTAGTGIAESDGSTGVSILSMASDGTNAGIYGSATPYKTIPYYPHINTATIDSEASNNQLGVEINVQAQDR